MRRRVLATVLGALILVLTGCAPLPGPLVMTGAPGSLCSSVEPGDEILIGQFVVGPAHGDAELTGAGVDGATGVAVTRAWVLPVLDGVLGSSLYPPTPSPAWAGREEIPGAEIPARESRNVVFLVRRTADVPAAAAAFTLDYTVDGVPYRSVGDFSIELHDNCLEDDDDE